MEAAYTRCDQWLSQAIQAIHSNHRLLTEFLKEHCPDVKAAPLEGTYLQWLDLRALGWTPKEQESIMEEADLFFDEGGMFGPEGEGFERMNLACPQTVILDGLGRFSQVVNRRKRGGGMIIEDNGSLNMADTLLVVDDVELNRAILAEIFQDSYQIEEAENGRAALEKLISGRERFCGVLLDVMMPEMDGISLLKILQGSHMTEEIPVFLITSETSPALWKEAYSLGIMDLIPKPVIPYIVRYRVDSVVRLFQAKRRLGSQVERQKDELLKKAEEMYRLSIGMAESLANVIEFKSDESSSHIRRIHEITMALLQDTRLGNGLSRRDIEQIGLAASCTTWGKLPFRIIF